MTRTSISGLVSVVPSPIRIAACLLGALALGFVGCVAASDEVTELESLDARSLQWVAPLDTDIVNVGETLDLAVYTRHPEARVIRFAVDGIELSICDLGNPDAECHEDEIWHAALTLEQIGEHTIAAAFTTAAGETIETSRVVYASAAGTGSSVTDPESSEHENDPTASNRLVDEGTSTVVSAISAQRGYLDPSRPMHGFNGGQEWRTEGQRVVLRSGTLDGSRTEATRCMQRYGTSIRRFADAHSISRATVIAALAARHDCEGVTAVPFIPLVRPGICAALTRAGGARLDPGACRDRMQRQPDFAIETLVRYLAQPSVRRQHRNDPPLIAAVLASGAVRASNRGAWHMRAPAVSIDRFVAAYNAYRTWEHRGAVFQASLSRVVHARMIQHGGIGNPSPWALDGHTATSVATALARLRPTYVSGLIRLGAGVATGIDAATWASHRAAWETVRNAVRAVQPDARFDVVMNARDYDDLPGDRAEDRIRRDMEVINTQLHPDAWFFDFWQPAVEENDGSREAVRAAIEWGHAHGQDVGGNTWGHQVPDGSDFASIQDSSRASPATADFELNTQAIAMLRAIGVPVTVHLNNDPQFWPNTESCYFMGQCMASSDPTMGPTRVCNDARNDFSFERRVHYLENRAGNQRQHDYRFMYPIFFPMCPVGVAYDATNDGSMMMTLGTLLGRYASN